MEYVVYDYNDYIEDQLLEMYMNRMDEVVEAFGSEMNEFEFILEAEGTELSTNTTPAANNKGAKLKAIFEKLRPYLDNFIEAFDRIIDIVKTKMAKLVPLVTGKFKVAGKAEDDITILKFDIAKNNAVTIDTIIKDVDIQIIKPVDGGQNPKTNTLDDFRNKFEEIEYNKIIKDDKNLMQFKKGAVIRNNTFMGVSNASADIAKVVEASAPRNRAYKKALNNIIPQTERAEGDASENLMLLNKALYFAIQLHQNIARYNTKLVGDLTTMSKSCSAVG